MPRRKGHKVGKLGCPELLQHYETRFNIRLTASKLTRTHRQLARMDTAVAEHLRGRIREPARFQALIAGRSSYSSDTQCKRCGGSTRTVYCASCWGCQTSRRPLVLNERGGVALWPPALRSRAGWLALCEQRQRERRGESLSCTFGVFTASTTPTGKLSIEAPALKLSIPDLSLHHFDFINNIVQRHPEFLDVLKFAGWT